VLCDYIAAVKSTKKTTEMNILHFSHTSTMLAHVVAKNQNGFSGIYFEKRAQQQILEDHIL
jgi:hypothetical protein